MHPFHDLLCIQILYLLVHNQVQHQSTTSKLQMHFLETHQRFLGLHHVHHLQSQTDNRKNIKDSQNGSVLYRNLDPPQNISPHCFFRPKIVPGPTKSISKYENKTAHTKQLPAARPSILTLTHTTNHNQRLTESLSESQSTQNILQAQSQYGPAGAAAVAVAAHRTVGAVEYRFS